MALRDSRLHCCAELKEGDEGEALESMMRSPVVGTLLVSNSHALARGLVHGGHPDTPSTRKSRKRCERRRCADLMYFAA